MRQGLRVGGAATARSAVPRRSARNHTPDNDWCVRKTHFGVSLVFFKRSVSGFVPAIFPFLFVLFESRKSGGEGGEKEKKRYQEPTEK